MIAGAGLTAPIAYRWKTQINENAKMPGVLARAARARPQRDRRLGGRRATLGPFRAVFLDDADTAPARARAHRADRASSIEPNGAGDARRRDARRRPPSSACFSLVLLGDLVSLYLAVLRGVDPTPVDADHPAED